MLASTSLANHRFKILGLIITLIAVILFFILKILDYSYEEGWEDRIFLMNHFIIVFGLFMIMYSSESNDDERVKLIRHSLLKFTFALMVSGIMFYLALTILDRVAGSFFIILYIIEAVLVCYQLLFRISLRTNPSWIFRQSRIKKIQFIILSSSLFFLIGWVILVAITFKI